MLMRVYYTEPYLAERIEKAKQKALFIRNATNIETVEQAEMVLRMVISDYYKIPFYDSYFDNRTTDELFFEAELIALRSRNVQQTSASVIKSHKKEADALADEMEKELEQEWVDLPKDEPLDPNLAYDPMFQMAKRFMETGKFAGESGFDQPQAEPITEQTEDSSDDWK